MMEIIVGNLTFRKRLVVFYEKKVYRGIFECEIYSLVVNGLVVYGIPVVEALGIPLVTLKASERIKEFSLGRWLFRKYKKIAVKG